MRLATVCSCFYFKACFVCISGKVFSVKALAVASVS